MYRVENQEVPQNNPVVRTGSVTIVFECEVLCSVYIKPGFGFKPSRFLFIAVSALSCDCLAILCCCS